jgi:hypothetical protein
MVAERPIVAPREKAESRKRMARAVLPNQENAAFTAQLAGRAVRRAMELQGWTLDRLALEVGKDVRQIGRWIDGSEHAQLDVLFAVEAFRASLVIGLAEQSGVADVETTIRFRRRTA